MSRKFALLIPCISTIAILIALCISLNYSGDALAAPPAAAPLEPAAPSWRISCPDCPPAFLPSGDRYLKLDPSGAPHMVFTGDGQLYHAWRAAGGWEVELIWVPYIIEPQLPVSVTSAALAFDSQGNLHIAYILSEIGDSVLYLYTQAPGMITYEIVAAFVDADGTVTGLEIELRRLCPYPLLQFRPRAAALRHPDRQRLGYQHRYRQGQSPRLPPLV